MNLAKALKTKSRLAQKIAQLQNDIQQHNSVPADKERKIDVTTMMTDLETAVNDLVRLKLTIFVASTPVRETILRLAEVKSRVSFLKGIDTHEGKGKESDSYRFDNLTDIDFAVEFDILWQRAEILKCEELIDSMQDELDRFNHKTEIEF